MSLSGALNTSLAGLTVTQQALQLVGSNVANAQTPGYVRKTIDQQSVATTTAIGVRMTAVTRSLDSIIQAQLRQETSGGGYADKLSELYQQLQTIYGTPGSSTAIDVLFSGFTTAMQALGASPNSSSAQSSAMNAARQLAQQLNSLSDTIQGMRSACEQGIAADINAANDALQQIAKINHQIATAASLDPTTATLMDQRDRYIDQLSQLMDVKVVKGDFNQVMIYTGTGFQLVGAQAATLTFNAQGTLTPNSQYNVDPTKSGVGTIMMTTPNGTGMDLIANGAIRSGEIHAYLQMRDQILPQAQTQLDEFAAQMSQGISDLTIAGTAVTVPSAGFNVDTAGLQTGNQVHLTYTDGAGTHNITIVRVDDPSVLPLKNTASNPLDRVIGINFAAGMGGASGVVAQLTAQLAGSNVTVSNPSGNLLQFVTAAPTTTVNALSETVTQTSLASGNAQMPLFMDGTSYYTSATTAAGSQRTGYAQRIVVNELVVSDPAALVNYSAAPPTLAGDSTRPDFIYNQMMTASFTYSPTTGLGGASNPMQGNLTTYLGQMLTQQGQNAANADSLKEGQDVVVNSLKQRMSNISDVNIDAEMTNLLTLQNIYAANARVFSTVQQMFDSLLKM